MQTDNRENEAQTQNQDDDGIDTETGALISVQLQHGAGRTTGTSGASRARANIAQRLLVVGSSTTAHGSARATGGSGRGRTANGGTGGGSSASGLGVRARLGARGERGGRTG